MLSQNLNLIFGFVGIVLRAFLTPVRISRFSNRFSSLLFPPGPVSDALLEDCLTKVHLNFRIWIYTPFTVQRELLIALARHVDKQPARLRNHCGLSQSLEILREFYWEKPPSSSAAGARPLYHPVTHDVIGQRPASQEVRPLGPSKAALQGWINRV